jgi:membrane-associated phospholipid phosphatase
MVRQLRKKRLLQPIDILVLIYSLINIFYILLGIILHGMDSSRMHNPEKHMIIFTVIIIFVFVISRLDFRFGSKFMRVVHDWYAILLFLYFFEATSAVNKIIFPEFLDVFFQNIDRMIFGYQPAVEWESLFKSVILNEVLCLAYFSYYLIGIFYLYIYIKDRSKFRMHAFILTFVFFTCYLTYNVLPVVGGRFLPGMMELTQEYRYGFFTRLMAFIYNSTPHLGGAFPSSHVAIALVVNLSAFCMNRKLGWFLLPIVFLLTIATVYCHYHYFIDTIFGVIYGIVFFYLGKNIYLKHFNKGNHV